MLARRARPRRMSAETYKGIDFVRISNLPEEQKNQITQTIDRTKIIKILRGKELLPDCIQVNDYARWMKDTFNKEVNLAKKEVAASRILEHSTIPN